MVKIGVPLRYTHLENGRGITFLSELIRIAIQKAGAFVIPIIPVQGVDCYETHYDDFKELNDIEKKQVDEYLNMVDGVLFPGGHKVTPYDEYYNTMVMLTRKGGHGSHSRASAILSHENLYSLSFIPRTYSSFLLSLKYLKIASARASSSKGSTITPVTPSSTTSGSPPTRVTMTGFSNP